MNSYFKRHPHRTIRAIHSIGSIAMNAIYFYVAQFLSLVITLSAIGGTNGSVFGQQIDISVLKSVNVIFLVGVACMIVAYILTLAWTAARGRGRVNFPTGPVLGIGVVHLLRYAGVYSIYSTGTATAVTVLGLILVYMISKGLASFAESKALNYMEHESVELSGDTFTIYAYPDSRDFMVTRSVEPAGYSVELHQDAPLSHAVEAAKEEIARREALMAMEQKPVSEPAEEAPAPVLDQDGLEEEIQDSAAEQVPVAASVEELRDTYARVISEKKGKSTKRLGAASKRKNLESTGRKLTAHERKLQSRIRRGRRHN